VHWTNESAMKVTVKPGELSCSESAVWCYILEFNLVVIMIMVVVYHFPALYVIFCGAICLILLPSYSRFTMDHASLCLLVSLLHASFHDYFMEGMGICDHAFIDSHLHYAMLWCVYKLLPSNQQEWFRSSRLIRGTLCANFFNCVFGMCLPALINYKETGIFNLKYIHGTGLNRLESWEYKLYGFTSLPSTIAIACYFVACTIVIRTRNILHLSKAILIATIIFSGTTAAYFIVDPYWLVSFYNKVKYDQLYFIVPAAYVYRTSLFNSHSSEAESLANTNVRRLTIDLESNSEPIASDLELSRSGLSPGLSLLEGDPTFSFTRYS